VFDMIYWFTGQPGSGKSTLALALQAVLRKSGHVVVHLDGEFLREITGNRDFTEAGRTRNIRAGQQLASKLHAEGVDVVASFVSPYRNLRDEFKKNGNVVEIYAHTTEIRGREAHFAPDFEPPQKSFVDIDTTRVSVEACIGRILQARQSPAAQDS